MSLRSRSTVSYLAMAVLLIVLALTGISGCGGGSSSSSSSGQSTAPSITSGSFKAAASTITVGGSTTLSWSVSGATSLSIDNGVGTVTGSSVAVTPSATTTYTLTAANAAGTSVTAQVTVTVVAEPSIASFTATPSLLNPVTLGTTTATLSWSTSDATTVSIDNSVGTVTGTSTTVTPSATTTYTLTATNAAGTSVTATATVGVRNKLAVLAGSMYPGYDVDGTGAAATFSSPTGIAADASGNLYVADSGGDEIRKITPEGVVTTIASGTALTTSTNAVRSRASRALDGDGASNFLARQARMRGLRSGARATPESSNALITHAGLNEPWGIAVSSDGETIYVADTENQIIRKIIIAADGTATMSTLAGTAGTKGSADGTGTAASFYIPRGIALDASGNLYVADTFNCAIRKITSAGVVSTLVGGPCSSTYGSRPTFDYPEGIAVDASGNLYVADTGHSKIQKITPAGVVSILAGSSLNISYADGTGTDASFNDPIGITVDASGNLYVADTGNDTIRKITAEGMVTTLAGTARTSGSTDGTGTAATFYYPRGIAVDASGNLYVGDTGNGEIRKITPSSVVTTFAGTVGGSADGTGTSASFYLPRRIAVDADSNVYVADSSNNTIRKITPAGVVTTLAGTAGKSGSADGTGTSASFNGPYGITVDASGNLYVADAFNSTIRKVTPAGVVTTLAGTAGKTGSVDGTGTSASFYVPYGITVDTSGNLYVADTFNCTIRKITPSGVVTTLAGTAWNYDYADGTGTAAHFYVPIGIAVDTGGNLYVTDSSATIRKITPAGVVTTFAGTAWNYGYADGAGTVATFDNSQGIAVDASGNVYVADAGNGEIRKITPAGVVTTIIGNYDNQTASTGILPASIYAPLGIAADSTGNLFITVPNAVLTLVP
jgi:sugar lactone lactonase YvrE